MCLIVMLSMLLVGCTVIGRADMGSSLVTQCLAESSGQAIDVTGVFIQPDDGYPPVLDELEDARCTIDITIYMLTDDLVFSALADAAERGVACACE